MSEEPNDELIADAINKITEKLSKVLLDDFLELPSELQMNLILIKSAQLLLANILCQIAVDNAELEEIANLQGEEIKELTFNCASSGFADKFDLDKH